MGERAAVHEPRRSRLLGAQGLPHARRSLARAALHGRLRRSEHDIPQTDMLQADMPQAIPLVAPQPDRLLWQEAEVVAIVVATPRIKIFRLRPRAWNGFTPGQHVDIRLTAPDGYQAERSYSIASMP